LRGPCGSYSTSFRGFTSFPRAFVLDHIQSAPDYRDPMAARGPCGRPLVRGMCPATRPTSPASRVIEAVTNRNTVISPPPFAGPLVWECLKRCPLPVSSGQSLPPVRRRGTPVTPMLQPKSAADEQPQVSVFGDADDRRRAPRMCATAGGLRRERLALPPLLCEPVPERRLPSPRSTP
jgi:hypothetical protein